MAFSALVFKGLLCDQAHFSSFSPNLSLHVLQTSLFAIPHAPTSLSFACNLSAMMTVALVYSGCYNKNTTGWVAENHKHLLFIVLDSEKFKIKAPADLVSGKGLLSGS